MSTIYVTMHPMTKAQFLQEAADAGWTLATIAEGCEKGCEYVSDGTNYLRDPQEDLTPMDGEPRVMFTVYGTNSMSSLEDFIPLVNEHNAYFWEMFPDDEEEEVDI